MAVVLAPFAELLVEAMRAMHAEPMRFHLPPVVEARAELLSTRDTSGAVRLRAIAVAIRTAELPGRPSASLAEVASVLRGGQTP
jgi:hypothetical protein